MNHFKTTEQGVKSAMHRHGIKECKDWEQKNEHGHWHPKVRPPRRVFVCILFDFLHGF